MSEVMERASRPYFGPLFFWKLLANPAAATTSMMMYCTMVTDELAQNESLAGSVSVRLHWSMFTAYFWKGKMAL